MLTNNRGTKHQVMKSLGYALLAGAGMTQTALVVFAADNGPAADVVPIVRINPDYPQAALTANMEGWVQLEFTIDANGAVVDPLVVDNCVWLNGQDSSNCKPDDMFKSSALKALSRWRYSPKVEDGVPVVREGVQTMIRFTLEEPEGCLYASKLYSVGARRRAQEVINEGGEVRLVDVPDGIVMICAEDRSNPGDYRWDVLSSQ